MYVLFFKQKTAYEMRISDWSSDVCSSDLREAMMMRAMAIGYREFPARQERSPLARERDESRFGKRLGQTLAFEAVEHAENIEAADAEEIGRASWRDRVCQIV